MRVGDAVFSFGRVGLDGNDRVWLTTANPVPRQGNPEPTEVRVLENDLVGADVDRPLAELDVTGVKFLRQGGQIRGDLARCSNHPGDTLLRQRKQKRVEFAHQPAGRVTDVPDEKPAGEFPPQPLGNLQTADGALQLFPSRSRIVAQAYPAGRPNQVFVNPDGSPRQLPSLVNRGLHDDLLEGGISARWAADRLSGAAQDVSGWRLRS